jgi:hypothetical protein
MLTAEERSVADKLFEKVLQIKESDGHMMIGTEIVDVFLKRHIQPVMSRAHHMWLYSGPMDETRVNVAELSEKELLDEVKWLTHFSQVDSIPMLALHDPYDLDHQPTEVTLLSLCYCLKGTGLKLFNRTLFSLPQMGTGQLLLFICKEREVSSNQWQEC